MAFDGEFAFLLSAVVLYSLECFNNRVQDEVKRWPTGVLADDTRLADLLLEFGPELRRPQSRSIGDGLLELWPRGREGIGKALYCFVIGRRVIVVHAFVKKTQATQDRDLAIARQRMKEVRSG